MAVLAFSPNFIFFPIDVNVQVFPKRQILDSSKLKEFADDNFKFDRNGGKFSKRIEITGAKGKLLFTSRFAENIVVKVENAGNLPYLRHAFSLEKSLSLSLFPQELTFLIVVLF